MNRQPDLSIAEYAKQRNCSESSVRRKIKNGELKFTRVGCGPRSPFRIPATELDAPFTAVTTPPATARPVRDPDWAVRAGIALNQNGERDGSAV